MDKLTRTFARIDDFLRGFAPLTPYGRDRKAAARFMSVRQELEREFDLTDEFIRYLKASGPNGEKAAWHLKRIPQLELPLPSQLDRTELFEIKKFLYNARAVFALLDDKIRAELGIVWTCEEILRLLSKDGETETFYLTAEPDSALAAARDAIIRVDRDMAELKANRCRDIKQSCGLDFSAQSFIVLDAVKAAALPDTEVYSEPHDARSVIVRPVYGRDYAARAARREELDLAEKIAAAQELTALSRAVRALEPKIAAAAAAIERVDTLLAKARFALAHRLTRPVFTDGALTLCDAVFVPLKTRLEADNLKYIPLSCSFKKPVGLVYGSNMGGKTVVLQTVAFMQLLAQEGYFVPAKKFKTRIFDAVRFVGSAAEPGAGVEDGLSGFGREISAFNSAYPETFKKTLLIMDEFARTTNSVEACALLSAVVQTLGSRRGLITLAATHFAGVARTPESAVYRMRGFDRRAFEKYSGAGIIAPEERLRAINRFMRYELIDDDGVLPAQDALSVARVLGLDAGIIDLAQQNMEKTKL